MLPQYVNSFGTSLSKDGKEVFVLLQSTYPQVIDDDGSVEMRTSTVCAAGMSRESAEKLRDLLNEALKD